MSYQAIARMPGWVGGTILLLTLGGGGSALAAWKVATLNASAEAAANQPEPMELVAAAPAGTRTYQPTTTAIGTVLALHSVTLRNEVPGTVRRVTLAAGKIVEPGTVLVALDVTVEEAQLEAQQAQLVLAQTTLGRLERLLGTRAVSAEEVDRARAERDVAQAEIARIRAIIERKTIRAPFRARTGLSDVHPGQYLSEGTVLTTLQSVGDESHVDFTVAQNVAARLRSGDPVFVVANGTEPVRARIVAVDSRVDATTRNTLVRARLNGDAGVVAPGASVRVRVPIGPETQAVAVPVSALRKGPSGDHVFVIVTGEDGKARAQVRQVKAGEVLGDEVLILEGVSAGEQVAASGAFKLREGVLVVLQGAAAAPADGSE